MACWRWTVGAALVLVLVLVWVWAGVWGCGVGVPVGGVGPAVGVVRLGAVPPVGVAVPLPGCGREGGVGVPVGGVGVVGVVWLFRPGAGAVLPVGDGVAALLACVRRGVWAGVVGV
ncbi:hypothetical protein [Streptomyces purpurascens]|uniref:hypothetical protein n=1 Tax=Streptomyces purpurascens TaxID=1924 RepID=UPI003C2F7AEF